MDLKKVNDALDRIFNEEKQRIVFWNDPDREFINHLHYILLEGVHFLRLDEVGALEAKIRLERDDPEGRYLLYAPEEEPEYEEDWLLDLRLYSHPFRADRSSLILDELGLAHQQLREHISKRRKFFDNKERLHKLKQFVSPDDNAQDLDRKMLAVVTRAEQAELFNIVQTLFHSLSEGEEVDLEVVFPVWEQIEKFDLEMPFWEMVKANFGYSEEGPSLRNLLIRLLVSDHARQIGKEVSPSLQHLRLSRSGTANAAVCLAQWRDSSSKGSSYNQLAREIGSLLHISDELHGYEIEELIDGMTFLEIDKAIVRGLLSRVRPQGQLIDAESVRAVATRRQAEHWVASPSVLEEQRRGRFAVYEALALGAEFLALRNTFGAGFDYSDATAMYRSYECELFRFDQLYRRFCTNADIAEAKGWDVLKPLREDIEACYCNWYLLKLGLAWGKCVEGELLPKWRIQDIPNEYEFFGRHVRPHLKAENRRAFVLVSDALRYEAAEELTRLLNGTYRFEAELSSQLGVLPSYTALGMASLLPHDRLEYSKRGDVLVDGKPASSLAQRAEVLKSVDGTAIRGRDLIKMTKEGGRAFVSDKRVVYIYHDEIDSTGDQASTETNTFDAVREAIGDLRDLVSYVVNSLNGNYILVTADHGFLFSETAPGETDKSKLTEKPAGTVKAKKRYLLGRNLPTNSEVWHGKTEATAKAEGEMEFWIPRGANRFHFVGGARYIHGGAMPQEIVVPVIRVKHLKDKKARLKTKTKYVTVQVLGANHKITAPKHRFTLIQMEPVSDRAKPVTLKVAVYERNEAVTSIETITFDSVSDNLDERQKSVVLPLQDREFNKSTSYRLVLRDADTGIDQQSVEVTIDRAITDDFDF